MAGAGFIHNQIAGNVMTDIGQFLKNKNCRIFTSDLKIHVESNSLFTYPDLSIICGRPEFRKDREDIFLNPSVIFEILSGSTHIYDRIEKFSLYREISSFREYILISSRTMRLEQYIKQS
jgi:Uma2 family endonuclease